MMTHMDLHIFDHPHNNDDHLDDLKMGDMNQMNYDIIYIQRNSNSMQEGQLKEEH